MHLATDIGMQIAEATSARVLTPQPQRVDHFFAVHGYDYHRQPTTFLFDDERLSSRAGWVNGHIADGTLMPADMGHAPYLVTVVEAD